MWAALFCIRNSVYALFVYSLTLRVKRSPLPHSLNSNAITRILYELPLTLLWRKYMIPTSPVFP